MTLLLMIEKIKYLFYLLKLFKDYSFLTKIYLMVRISILPFSFLKLLLKTIWNNDNLLDIWCWFWITSLYIKFKWLNNKILWLDISWDRINKLNEVVKNDQNISFIKRDLISEWFSWLEGYNTAILVDLLHHIDEKTQSDLLLHLSQNVSTIIVKDIDIFPKYKFYWNYFHDRYLMNNKLLCFLWSKKVILLLQQYWYDVEYKKIFSIFPYPHYLLIAKK